MLAGWYVAKFVVSVVLVAAFALEYRVVVALPPLVLEVLLIRQVAPRACRKFVITAKAMVLARQRASIGRHSKLRDSRVIAVY